MATNVTSLLRSDSARYIWAQKTRLRIGDVPHRLAIRREAAFRCPEITSCKPLGDFDSELPDFSLAHTPRKRRVRSNCHLLANLSVLPYGK